jgi:hypothetical protein
MTMKICCPACHSESVERVTSFNTSSDIAHQYRTSNDKGACIICGSLWFFSTIVPHMAKKSKQPSYQ